MRSELEGPFLLALLDALLSTPRGTSDEMGAAGEVLARFGADLFAAELTAAAAEEARLEGDQRAATAWARRSKELVARCQGAATPVIAVQDAPVPLSRREREVASLVAAGLSSRAVAEQLYLSVRTVENHLARVYDKLGVSSRAELAAALGEEVRA
jgi:DNA-binding NarL/FixJ family response regulator